MCAQTNTLPHTHNWLNILQTLSASLKSNSIKPLKDDNTIKTWKIAYIEQKITKSFLHTTKLPRTPASSKASRFAASSTVSSFSQPPYNRTNHNSKSTNSTLLFLIPFGRQWNINTILVCNKSMIITLLSTFHWMLCMQLRLLYNKIYNINFF